EEIERLGAETVYVLGGNKAINEKVLDDLRAEGIETVRVAGDSRTETAVEIAEIVLDGGSAEEVVVVNGYEFADALSVASYAAKESMPILLTQPDRLPAATETALSELGIEETLVIGGEVAITDNVADLLPNVTRVAGDNRFETSVEVAKYFNPDTTEFYVTTGFNFPDALASGARAAKDSTGIILIGHTIHDYHLSFILDNNLNKLNIVGGEEVIDQDLFNELSDLIQ